MLLTAEYYPNVLLNPESMQWQRDCVVLRHGMLVEDVLPYALYKARYGRIKLTYVSEDSDAYFMPSLLNMHMHIELYYMHKKTVQGQGFYAWLQSLLALRQKEQELVCDAARADQLAVIERELGVCSSILSSHTIPSLSIPHIYFVEQIGQQYVPLEKPYRTPFSSTSMAGHALYSTASDVLQQAKLWTAKNTLPYSIHLAEHEEEIVFLASDKQTPFRNLMQQRLMPNGVAPKMTPVAYADSLHLLDEKTLAVHCVHVTQSDIAILAQKKVCVCLCPRSNMYIEQHIPEYAKLKKAGVMLCLGTDSLASNDDVSLFNEIAFACKQFNVSLEEILPLVTTNPARFLGYTRFGAIAKNAYAKLVQIPKHCLQFSMLG